MEYRRFSDKIVMRVDRGEDIVEKLSELCSLENIHLGSVSGIGAVSSTEIGIFNVDTKEYFSKTFEGLYEVSNLTGNISEMNGKTYLHLHITIGDVKENKVYAGHLNRAVVGATAEIIISTIDGELDRQKDETIGLNIFNF